MKKFSKIFVIVLAVFAATIFAACGGSENGETPEVNSNVTREYKDITGVAFDDAEYDYDGIEHSLTVRGDIPAGVSVMYINNTAAGVGVYSAKAILSGKGYRTLTLTAKLTIKEAEGVRVSTVEELTAALENGGTIILSQDLTVGNNIDLGENGTTAGVHMYAGFTIDNPTVLIGGGHTITAAGFSGTDYRILNITASDCRVSVSGLTLESDMSVPYLRGINITNNEDLTLHISDVTVNIPTYYGLNIHRSAVGLKVVANNISVTAWGAVTNHASGVVFEATNSYFKGINKYKNAAGSSGNSFSTIVMSDYILYFGDEFVATELSADNTFTFDNCRIVSSLAPEAENVVQKLFDIRSPFNNKLYLNDCKFVPCGDDCDKIYSAFDSAYLPDEHRNDEHYVINTNKVYIDGADVTENENIVEKYYDE